MVTKKNSPITTFIFGIVFIVGAWLTYTNFSKPMAEEADATKSWPTAPGVITNSDIRQSESDGTTMYSADISYDFVVDGKPFSGNRITINSGGTSTSSIKSVKKDLQKYPVDATVTVFYDPELPNNAVLEPGADFFTYIIKYLPFLFGLLGVAMLWQIVKKIGILLLALFIGTRK
jgi:hypothetical protein